MALEARNEEIHGQHGAGSKYLLGGRYYTKEPFFIVAFVDLKNTFHFFKNPDGRPKNEAQRS